VEESTFVTLPSNSAEFSLQVGLVVD